MLDIEVIAQPAQAEDRPPVAGFSAWFDASDPGTIQGGGTGVSEWRDKSGNGRHLAQATDANRPYTGSWSQNGRNVIWSQGKAAVLSGPVPMVGHPWAVAMAVANTASDAVQRTAMSGFYTAGNEWGRVYRPTSNAISIYSGAVISSPQLWERNRPRVVIAVFDAAQSDIRVDGRTVTFGSTPAVGNSVSQSVFGLGLSESWYGWIGELIYYESRALTTSELERTEQYLVRKWGIR